MIYDITPSITSVSRCGPATRRHRAKCCRLRRGDNITLSTLRATVHLGAHADAPSHYGADAPAIHERSLDYYVGACQVMRVAAARGTRVSAEMLPQPIQAERVLIATGTFPDFEQFNTDFAALGPELVERLHGQGVKLIGIDTPSVDLFDSKDLPSHQMFLRCDMAILEGLALGDVPSGLYELIALPLKLVGFDASPVRAILRNS